jgi:hypothetical protein
MAFNNTAMNAAATAIAGLITHVQAHSADAGPSWSTLAVGVRVAVTESVAAGGTITITATFPDGTFSANQAIDGISYWNQLAAGGTNYGGIGGAAFTGDATANSAGGYVVNITETASSS